MDSLPEATQASAPRWRPLAAMDRRVLGVLVEKAKTTPDGYPMSISAIRTACNQKNNRFPLMEVELEDVEESLARLRAAGAVTEVQGGSRVPRYRHHFYDWLAVDKVEAAVMAELLLRGAQSEGELRGRAARMEPIADLAALRPVLQSLKAKGLVVPLTPEGRGHVLTHAIYEERELEKLRGQHAGGHAREMSDQASESAEPGDQQAPARPAHDFQQSRAELPHARGSRPDDASVAQLRSELGELKAEVTKMRKDIEDLWATLR